MWNKSFAGFICGLLVLVLTPSSIALFFKHLAPMVLAFTTVLGISAWAGVMTWCYAADSGKQAWQRGLSFSLPLAVVYAIAFFSQGVVQ